MTAAQRLFKRHAFFVFDRLQRDYWRQYVQLHPHQKKYDDYKIKQKRFRKKHFSCKLIFEGPDIIIEYIYDYDSYTESKCNYVLKFKDPGQRYTFYPNIIWNHNGIYLDNQGNVTTLDPNRIYYDEKSEKLLSNRPLPPFNDLIDLIDSEIMNELIFIVEFDGCIHTDIESLVDWLGTVDILEMDFGKYGHFHLHVYERMVEENFERVCLLSKIARSIPGEYIVEPLMGSSMKPYLAY